LTLLAYMSFPAAHRPKLHSTNPIERVTGVKMTRLLRRRFGSALLP
jgi:transposase-like protein